VTPNLILYSDISGVWFLDSSLKAAFLTSSCSKCIGFGQNLAVSDNFIATGCPEILGFISNSSPLFCIISIFHGFSTGVHEVQQSILPEFASVLNLKSRGNILAAVLASMSSETEKILLLCDVSNVSNPNCINEIFNNSIGDNCRVFFF
jgi:hypothetical protein